MLYLAIESLAKTLNTSVAKYTNKKISILKWTYEKTPTKKKPRGIESRGVLLLGGGEGRNSTQNFGEIQFKFRQLKVRLI